MVFAEGIELRGIRLHMAFKGGNDGRTIDDSPLPNRASLGRASLGRRKRGLTPSEGQFALSRYA